MTGNILFKPVQTEKLVKLGEENRPGRAKQYAFEVALDANKIQIRQAVEALYTVKVTSVRTAIRPARRKSRMTRAGIITGHTQQKKRAYVTIALGQEIDFYKTINA